MAHTFGIALLVMSIVFFAVCLVIMAYICITEENAKKEAKRTGGVYVRPVTYNHHGKILYMEDLKGEKK